MSVIVVTKYLILFTQHSNTYAVVPFCALSITKQGLLLVEDKLRNCKEREEMHVKMPSAYHKNACIE